LARWQVTEKDSKGKIVSTKVILVGQKKVNGIGERRMAWVRIAKARRGGTEPTQLQHRKWVGHRRTIQIGSPPAVTAVGAFVL